MIIDTVNRFARGMDYNSLVGNNSIALVTDVAAPGTDYQNASYGMNGTLRQWAGLGTVLSDITSGNFTALPTDIIAGLSTGDIGSYVIVGGLALLLISHLGKGGGKSKSRSVGRRARLLGLVAMDQSLLKAS